MQYILGVTTTYFTSEVWTSGATSKWFQKMLKGFCNIVLCAIANILMCHCEKLKQIRKLNAAIDTIHNWLILKIFLYAFYINLFLYNVLYMQQTLIFVFA